MSLPVVGQVEQVTDLKADTMVAFNCASIGGICPHRALTAASSRVATEAAVMIERRLMNAALRNERGR